MAAEEEATVCWGATLCASTVPEGCGPALAARACNWLPWQWLPPAVALPDSSTGRPFRPLPFDTLISLSIPDSAPPPRLSSHLLFFPSFLSLASSCRTCGTARARLRFWESRRGRALARQRLANRRPAAAPSMARGALPATCRARARADQGRRRRGARAGLLMTWRANTQWNR